MGRSTVVVIWLALVALSLRPLEGIERVSRLVFEPARVLGRVALPLSSGGEAQAAGESEARGRVRELLLAEQLCARPSDPALLERRGLVHAQVYERSQEQADIVLLRFPREASIEPGMPVVCGDVYVGSVIEVGRPLPRGAEARAALRGPVPLAPGEARVRLVTAEGARVGARCGPLELVAGGLARAEGAGARLLAVRALQREPGPERELRVHEDSAAGGEWSTLAEGYRLGTLVELPLGSRTIWAIEPLLDYGGGIAQVFVLCPPERAPAGALLAVDPFEPRCWLDVRAALDGVLVSWRETRRLLSGSRAGLQSGAAVACGSEFVGRIARADYLGSDVECLGDPGFRLLVLASVPGRSAPLQLGRVRSLGCDVSRRLVYLAWEESAEIARALGGNAAAAQLYTSSGERGVPPGLHLGEVLLPARAGAHVLVLRRAGAGEWGTRLSAWIGERAEPEEP
jgi:hypothetical protein